jgi:hypothetical protein
MSIYESPSTPAALGRYLVTYISDDSAIIAHIKHRFGVQYDKADIAKFRKEMPRKYMQGQGQPSKWDCRHDPDMRGAKPKVIGNLAAAIRKHHPKIVACLEAQHVAKYGKPAR